MLELSWRCVLVYEAQYFYINPILMCCNFSFCLFMLNTVTMKTVDVTNLDPLRNFLIHIQEIDAGIAAQEWRKIHSIYVYI